MTNREIASVFEQVADLLEFEGANPFRIRAYRNGARRIAELTEPIAAIAADSDRDLTDLDGIGKDLADKIATLLETGTLPFYEELKARIPESVLSMLRVPHLGPKKAAILYHTLGIATLDQLKAACEAGAVQQLKGFGKKTQDKILAGIDLAVQSEMRIYWSQAEPIVEELLSRLRQEDYVHQIEVAGSYRRGKETVGDLDFLVEATDADAVMDQFAAYDPSAELIGRGKTKLSIRLACGLQIDVRVVPAESFGAAFQYFTGSKDHNIILRGLAKERGLKINEWGVFQMAPDHAGTAPDSAADAEEPIFDGPEIYLAGRTEKEVYAALDLPCFPPELREAREEFEWAASGKMPQLIELADIRGDLHMHTTASDGTATIEDMIAAAQKRGLEYIAITDHSKRVTMAHGLDSRRLLKQWALIDSINRELDRTLTILKGVECDILEKGGMDLPDHVLAKADWTIASIHYGQNQSRAQITDRIVDALKNPHVDVLAHPTGRLINRRDAYPVDMEAVLQAAAEYGKMLELNAHPSRLDLNDIHCAAAKRLGIPIVINTDAHSTLDLDVMRFGVLQARRAGLTAADVANTRPLSSFRSN